MPFESQANTMASRSKLAAEMRAGHREVDRPLGRDDGVIVKVRAAAANPYDWHFMRGEVR
jgi:NADPH:quinone reductase-like Zn-dependent oxidoreductase